MLGLMSNIKLTVEKVLITNGTIKLIEDYHVGISLPAKLSAYHTPVLSVHSRLICPCVLLALVLDVSS